MNGCFKPYKGRMVKVGEVVEVFHNLIIPNTFSIRLPSQKLMVAHCSSVTLTDCELIVSGQQTSINQIQKQVHPVVRGKILGINQPRPSLNQVVTYNLYEQNTFYTVDTLQTVKSARSVHCEGNSFLVSAFEQVEFPKKQFSHVLEA